MKIKTLFLAAVIATGLTQIAFANGDQTVPSDETHIPRVAAQPDSYFFTDKPYDAELGGYVFAARTYDPEINRWITPDPSGFPDGSNVYLYGNNIVTRGIDPDGKQFLLFDGSSLSVWSGSDYQSGGTVDWGDRSNDWAALSGGGGDAPINDGWWSVGSSQTLGYAGTGHRPEYDYVKGHPDWQYTGTGTAQQGSMSAWSDKGYDKGHIQYKYSLSWIAGRGLTDPGRTGIKIHPDGPVVGITAECVGITGYDNAVAVKNFLSSNSSLELYVE